MNGPGAGPACRARPIDSHEVRTVPAILSEEQFGAGNAPARWASVLADLEDFLRTERSLREAPADSETAGAWTQFVQLHDRLVQCSADLLEPEVLADRTPAADAELFARAVHVLMRLNDCVGADRDCLDTAGSLTLGKFEPDYRATVGSLRNLRLALARFPDLSGPRREQIERQVEQDLDDARRKQRLVRAICDEFQLRPDADNLRQHLFRFFESCYGATGLTADEVELIITGCMIFFCLPYEGLELLTSRFKQATEIERQPVIEFLRRVNRFAHWQFAHFPVFGFLKGESLSPDLLQRLAQRADLTIEQVSYELSRLIAIVPLQELDKYVVHDVWGHSWQASMLHYDRAYEQLATFADALTLATSVTDRQCRPRSFRECFRLSGSACELDEEAFGRFVQDLIETRVPTAMTPVMAELIADVAEHKFVVLQPDRAADLPSSSRLRRFPSKLDLVMRDIAFYFPQASKIFRLWAQRESHQRRTVEELCELGAERVAAVRSVERAVQRWRDLERERYAAQLAWRRVGNRLEVNMYTRLALNFLGVHRATLTTYERLERLDVGNLPLRSFRDLMLITAAIFFEEDPRQNLWRIDEFLTLRVEPLCLQLAQL